MKDNADDIIDDLTAQCEAQADTIRRYLDALAQATIIQTALRADLAIAQTAAKHWAEQMAELAVERNTLTARCEALQGQLGTAEGTIELLKRRALQAEQRSEVLEAALEDVNAFLKHIEWNDTTSEHDAGNLRHQIEVACSTPR